MGVVFEITPGGRFTLLHSFGVPGDGADDGGTPYGALIQATDGNLYGTTAGGGAFGFGTVFKITTGGTLTTLFSFEAYTSSGVDPFAGLIQATDGNLYGTATGGGLGGGGTVFKITTGGTFTSLHTFDASNGVFAYGDAPYGGLVQATNGELYGTTLNGGAYNDGTIFRMDLCLPRFVETLPTSGAVGAAVTILGNDLTGATSVSFHGTTATFHVVSSTEIKATVPGLATTGKIEVVTPSRTLSSNVAFRVTP